MITSNPPFDDLTETFGSERLTGALLDRLTHHVSNLEMNGDSDRLAKSKARQTFGSEPNLVLTDQGALATASYMGSACQGARYPQMADFFSAVDIGFWETPGKPDSARRPAEPRTPRRNKGQGIPSSVRWCQMLSMGSQRGIPRTQLWKLTATIVQSWPAFPSLAALEPPSCWVHDVLEWLQ